VGIIDSFKGTSRCFSINQDAKKEVAHNITNAGKNEILRHIPDISIVLMMMHRNICTAANKHEKA
jgi:hypothetical protein